MAWVGINTSGVAYTFGPTLPFAATGAGTLDFAGDVLTGVDFSMSNAGLSPPGWALTFSTAQQVRVTVQAFSSAAYDPAAPAAITSATAPLDANPTQTSTSAMSPTVAEATGSTGLAYTEPGIEGGPSSFQILIEVWVEPAAVVEPCEELGRTTRAYVSGYHLARTHRSRMVRGVRRCLTANFNGAIPKSRSITAVTWRCDVPQCIYMRDAAIVTGGREVRVNITAQLGAECRVKCEATLDNGEVYNQVFVLYVRNSPWFFGEVASPATGPYELTATI